MTGTALDYEKHCKLPFGAYVETHEERSRTNTLYERTQGAICLGLTSNFQGSYKFLCLNTGRKITRKQIREVPMPEHVIKRIEAIAERDKQLGDMVFTDRDDNPIGNYDDDNAVDDTNDTDITGVDIKNSNADMEEEQAESEASEQHGTTDNGPEGILLEPSANDESLYLLVDPNQTAEVSAPFEEEHETAGVDDEIDLLAGIDMIEEDSETALNGIAPDEPPGVTEETPTGTSPGVTDMAPMWTNDGTHTGDIEGMPDGTSAGDVEGMPTLSSRGDEDSSDDEDDDDADDSHDEIPDDEVYHPESMTPSLQRVYGLRPRRGRYYINLHATIAHHAMTQYSLKKGLKKFQGKAEDAVSKELMQLHMKDTFAPQDATELTEKQKREHLNRSCS
jgi:hypothetical protein